MEEKEGGDESAGGKSYVVKRIDTVNLLAFQLDIPEKDGTRTCLWKIDSGPC